MAGLAARMSLPDAKRRLRPADSIAPEADVDAPARRGEILTPMDVEAIAEATARKLAQFIAGQARTFGLVDARELAERLGVSLDYVYEHATELGAMRLGSGPKARIRFELDLARQTLEARTRRSNRKRRR